MQAQYGLLGRRLSHSYSKTLHEKFGYYPYDLIELDEEKLKIFLTEKTFKGVNVTIPYKQTVLPYLDVQDESCSKVGACNCIVNENGVLTGYNTDYYGIAKTFERADVSIKGKKVLIFGNGGVSKAYLAYVKSREPESVHIVYHRMTPGTITMEQAVQEHGDAQILINATPVGMDPNRFETPFDIANFPAAEFVVDPVYNPLETRLLSRAKEAGVKTMSGLYMLEWQAAKACELFENTSLDPEMVDGQYAGLLQSFVNIALVGMPSSGKSTLAALLSKETGREIIEVDAEIEKAAGKTCTEIFGESGEEEFRRMETEHTRKAAAKKGAIISCGGGVVLKDENIEALKQNSIVIYIKRALELLISEDESRPALKQGLENLYQKRKDLYEKAADIVIENDGTLEDAFKKLLQAVSNPASFARFDAALAKQTETDRRNPETIRNKQEIYQ
jgi:shikimate dehydrogenase